MTIGKQCPRIQGLGALYASEGLRRAWCDYIGSVLRLCKHIIETLQKPGKLFCQAICCMASQNTHLTFSVYSQLSKAVFLPFKSEFGSFEDEITRSCQAVRDEVSLASEKAQKAEYELQARERSENVRGRYLLQKLWDNSSSANEGHQKWLMENHTRKLERKKSKILDVLSTYDYRRIYRRIRKECMPGTSQWICRDPIFREWLDGPTKTLCFTGKCKYGTTSS